VLVSGWQQAITLLLAVIPGFIYQGTRSSLRGPTPEDREIGLRILRALAVSGFLALVYVGILGSCLTDAVTHPVTDPHSPLKDHPQRTAWALIALIFVVPIVIAVLVQVADGFSVPERITSRLYKIVRITDRVSPYDKTPTAWDFAGNNLHKGFVRVLTKDQKWRGGYLGSNSYLTGYPEAREIFLQEAWLLADDGSFIEAANGTAGVWIRCDDVQLVEFLEEGGDTRSRPERTLISVKLCKGKKLQVVMASDA
jgi:uncharacterized protein DUF6338